MSVSLNINKRLFEFRSANSITQSDIYVSKIGQKINLPTNDWVISRREDGSILSKIGDSVWDFAPYDKDNKYKVDFNHISRTESVLLCKKILFSMMVGGINNNPYSPNIIYSSYLCLRNIEEYASKKSLSLLHVLTSKHLIHYYTTLKNQTILIHSISLYNFLRHKESITGITIKDSSEISNLIINATKHYRKIQQTQVIPLRILIHSNRQRLEQIEEVYMHIDSLCLFIERVMTEPFYALTQKQIQIYTKENCISWNDAIIENNLNTLFNKYNIQNKTNLKRLISSIQSTCAHILAMNTAMRSKEITSIGFGCIKTNDNDEVFISGISTKYYKRAQHVEWVTHKKLLMIIKVLEKISSSLQKRFSKKIDCLFISSICLNQKLTAEKASKGTNYFSRPLPLDKKITTITTEDMYELKQIFPRRNWNKNSKYSIGKEYKFKSHQYRRSFFMYAKKSGLVSDASLQRQGKQKTSHIQQYYQKNFHAVRDINSPNFAKYVEIINDKNKSIIQFNKNSEMIDKRDQKTNKAQIHNNKNKTINDTKKGLISYVETNIGGCSNPTSCQLINTNPILEEHFKNHIVSNKNLQKAITYQELILRDMDSSNPLYRREKNDLDFLYKILKEKM
jgi:hypothetical protein